MTATTQRETILVCTECRKSFARYLPPSRVRPRPFCSVLCRNRYLARNKPMIKAKHCPICGHIGYRKGVYCQPHMPKEPRYITWTPEDVAYLRIHYPTDGAEVVGKALNRPLKSVRSKANRLHIRLTKEAVHRIVYAKSSVHMSTNNPMWRPEVVEKVRKWHKQHPEAYQRLLEGHQRLERDKPSKLEKRLRAMLSELRIDFEPSFLIKPKFIVDIRIGSLIIQADGDYWHGHLRFEPLTERQIAQQRRDRAQDAYLRTCGYTIARIWESDLTIDWLRTILEQHNVIPPE